MNLRKQFQTDEKAEVDGVWVPLSATAKIKVARSGNPRHSAAMKRLTKPYLKPGMRANDIADDVFLAIAKEAMAEAILVDWDGIVNDNDEPLPFSKHEAMVALEFNDFYQLVWNAANAMENYRVARLAELEKN